MVVTRSMMATSAPSHNIVLRTAEDVSTPGQDRTGPGSDTEDDDDEYSESGSSSTDQNVDNDTALTGSASSTSGTLDNASASSRTRTTTSTTTATRPHQPRRVVLRWLRTIRNANSYRLIPIRRRVGICFLCNQIKTLTQRVEFGTNALDCGRNCAYRVALSCPGRDRMR